jgi:hypothetical protein
MMSTDLLGEGLDDGVDDALATDCPGREPPFLAVQRPARPFKSPIQNRFTVGNAKGA